MSTAARHAVSSAQMRPTSAADAPEMPAANCNVRRPDKRLNLLSLYSASRLSGGKNSLVSRLLEEPK